MEKSIDDANAGVQLILQRSRLHSPFTAYVYNQSLCGFFGRESPRGVDG